jgi:hypothetical protein
MFIKYHGKLFEVESDGQIKGEETLTCHKAEDQVVIYFHDRPEGEAQEITLQEALIMADDAVYHMDKKNNVAGFFEAQKLVHRIQEMIRVAQ